ncbi:MAG: type II 3-dehydroquinate dehydratase [Candidatus Omnitrophica bacterium]|nr:type II 3-dehydroquinate dehydratase [Candidatus Omnitrophota bacterium]
MPKILVIHGPNLDLLGTREPDIYGTTTMAEINEMMLEKAQKEGIEIEYFQSNHEGKIVDKIGEVPSEKVDLIIINPAAYTHTSLAIRDAIQAVSVPTIEVHLSNIYAREEVRQQSLIAPACIGQISGFGAYSYILALLAAANLLNRG